MSYVMMTIKNWQRGDATVMPSTSDVCAQFNLAADDIDTNFGVIPMGSETDFVVMASVEAAKKMLAQHVDNTVAGRGPFVEGPYTNSPIQPINFP